LLLFITKENFLLNWFIYIIIIDFILLFCPFV
jgi:hypothetical protein